MKTRIRIAFARFCAGATAQELIQTILPDLKPFFDFEVSRAPEAAARQRYGAVIAYFATTLQDLTETVTRLMGGPHGLIYIHHPHLENLRTGGAAFNNIVSQTIRDVAARNNVRYYDAGEDLKIEFGPEAERYYIPNDMHFNERGLKAYSLAVAKYLATTIPGD